MGGPPKVNLLKRLWNQGLYSKPARKVAGRPLRASLTPSRPPSSLISIGLFFGIMSRTSWVTLVCVCYGGYILARLQYSCRLLASWIFSMCTASRHPNLNATESSETPATIPGGNWSACHVSGKYGVDWTLAVRTQCLITALAGSQEPPTFRASCCANYVHRGWLWPPASISE